MIRPDPRDIYNAVMAAERRGERYVTYGPAIVNAWGGGESRKVFAELSEHGLILFKDPALLKLSGGKLATPWRIGRPENGVSFLEFLKYESLKDTRFSGPFGLSHRQRTELLLKQFTKANNTCLKILHAENTLGEENIASLFYKCLPEYYFDNLYPDKPGMPLVLRNQSHTYIFPGLLPHSLPTGECRAEFTDKVFAREIHPLAKGAAEDPTLRLARHSQANGIQIYLVKTTGPYGGRYYLCVPMESKLLKEFEKLIQGGYYGPQNISATVREVPRNSRTFNEILEDVLRE